MSTRTDYTPEEWQLLLSSFPLVGSIVVSADPSGLVGIVQESLAASKSAATAARHFPDNALLQAIAPTPETMKSDDMTRARQQLTEQVRSFKSPAEYKPFALDRLREVVALLDRKATEQEAGEIRKSLYMAAENTAKAAKEGGFLGLGGTRVSEAEAATLEEIAHVLGVQRPAVPGT